MAVDRRRKKTSCVNPQSMIASLRYRGGEVISVMDYWRRPVGPACLPACCCSRPAPLEICRIRRHHCHGGTALLFCSRRRRARNGLTDGSQPSSIYHSHGPAGESNMPDVVGTAGITIKPRLETAAAALFRTQRTC